MNTKYQVLNRSCFFDSLKLNMRKCKNEKRSHTEAHITERLTQIFIKCPKYLNKNPALFRHKSHMTAEIQANWENWKKKKPKQPGIHRKYF